MREPSTLENSPRRRSGEWALRLGLAAGLAAASPAFSGEIDSNELLRSGTVAPKLEPIPGAPSPPADPAPPFQTRILDGSTAAISAWPSFVRIFGREHLGQGFSCGGTIVGKQWVLTAGHCADGIVAGDYRVMEGIDDVKAKGRELHVDRVYLHESYHKGAAGAPRDDIALLHLSAPAGAPAQMLIPNALVDTAARGGVMAEVAGFGVTTPQTGVAGEPGATSNHLLSVAIPIVARPACAGILTAALELSADTADFVDEANICAGDPAVAGHQACFGDSGGPLVADIGGRRAQIGVVSWGAGCGVKGTVGVYASVGHFEDWIRAHVEDAVFAPADGAPAQVAAACGLPSPPATPSVALEVAEGGKTPAGSAIQVRATSQVAGQLLVYSVDLSTCRLSRLFPDKKGKGAVVRAGETISMSARDSGKGASTGAYRLYALVLPANARVGDLPAERARAMLRELRAGTPPSGAAKVEAIGVRDFQVTR